MVVRKIVLPVLLSFFAILVLASPSFAATPNHGTAQGNRTYVYLTAKNASGQKSLSTNATTTEACGISTWAGQNNPTMLEGNTTVNCTQPEEIVVNNYADYCNAGAYNTCWGGYTNKAAFPQCSTLGTHLFCGTWYKSVGKNQIWRFRSETCVWFSTGEQCTEEDYNVSF